MGVIIVGVTMTKIVGVSGSEFAESEWEDGVILARENDLDWHRRACGCK